MIPPNAEAAAMGERLIRQCEGCRLAPYQDSGGVWTIGIGSILMSDGSPVTANTPEITSEEADALLMGELMAKIYAVDASLTFPATVGQRAALYSFAYNEGVGAERSSTLLHLLNNIDVAGASAQFMQWVYCKGQIVSGLVNRRKLERAVFDGLVIP